jgi:hypothetical protein
MVTLSEFLRHTTKLTQEVVVAKRERDGLRMECKCLTEENGKLRRNLEAEKEKVSACAGSMTRALIKANAMNDALAARVAELEAANGNSQASLDGSPKAASGGNLQAAIDGSRAASGGGSNASRLSPALRRVAAAFNCVADDEDDLIEAAQCLVRERDTALQAASGGGEQPRGWLTEEERRAIKRVFYHLFDTDQLEFTDIVTLDALLARSSSPEVVKPGPWKAVETSPGERSWQPFMDQVTAIRDSEWLAAIAAAGVAVKEVGSE